jgi:allantoate deiminase
VPSAGIDGDRLLARLDQLAASAASPGGGVTRLAWSEQDVRDRALVAGWLEEAGIVARTDAVGNLIAEIGGADPGAAPLVTGSHLDTVHQGGPLDGAYGVVAGVEALSALTTKGRAPLYHPVRLAVWANEEGVVAPPFTGSRSVAGTVPDVALVGVDGWTLAERITSGGGAPAHLATARWEQVAGYVELHIEQGPVLDRAGLEIGVVTGITACQRGWLTVTGQANHAGTTPMDARQDALVAAAHLVLAVQALASGTGAIAHAATVGNLEVAPGNLNVVPGRARVGYDLRSVDDAGCTEALKRLDRAAAEIAGQTGTHISRRPSSSSSAVPTDDRWRAIVAHVAAARGLSHTDLASGAGHDAQHLAPLGPIGMVFVPSIDGVSHSPAEATSARHLVAGAEVLLDALCLADKRFRAEPSGAVAASGRAPRAGP